MAQKHTITFTPDELRVLRAALEAARDYFLTAMDPLDPEGDAIWQHLADDCAAINRRIARTQQRAEKRHDRARMS